MLQSTRTSIKLIAAVLGVVAAGIPILSFNAWVRSQGEDEASVTAAWALAAVEMRLGQAVAAVRDLSKRGVDSCQRNHVDAMRQAALRTAPVKEIVLLAPDGQILCTDNGTPPARQVVMSAATSARAEVLLDVVRLAERGDRFLRVRSAGPSDRPSVAALVPASLLLPPMSIPGGRMQGDLRITMLDGTVVAVNAAQRAPLRAHEAQQQAWVQSKRYGLALTVAAASRGVIANYDDLRRIGLVVTAATALILLGAALAIFRRKSEVPIAEIAKAMLANEFEPYYQPVVDIQTGRLLGAEVLVRWRRTDGSLVEPNVFVSLMETSGLMPELTRSLMRRVRNDLGAAIGRRPEMTIAFNVMPQHFDDALILNDVGTIFDGSPIKLTQIVLELTERHEVENLNATRRTIAALQGLGCKVAIDDVGTGHNGLSYILKLGVDIIKVDKIFVEAIETEGYSRAIIETLIDLAKNMRMEIIAEGVETFDQVSYLRERGICAAQGYVFAPPLPASSFLQLLDAMDPVADTGRRAGSIEQGGASANARGAIGR